MGLLKRLECLHLVMILLALINSFFYFYSVVELITKLKVEEVEVGEDDNDNDID